MTKMTSLFATTVVSVVEDQGSHKTYRAVIPCQPKFCGNSFLKSSLAFYWAAIKNPSHMYSTFSRLIWSQTFQCIPWYSLIPLYRLPIPYVSQIQFSPLQTLCVCMSVRQKGKQNECLRTRDKYRKKESTENVPFIVWMDHYVFMFQITQLGKQLLDGNNIENIKTTKAVDLTDLRLDLDLSQLT